MEAPEGQPTVDGSRRPRGARPSGKPNERRVESGPRSSVWTKAARKNVERLSRTTAWKAGRFWEEMKGDAKIYLEKGGEKKMMVEKLVGKDGQRFWFKDFVHDTPKHQAKERRDDKILHRRGCGGIHRRGDHRNE